MSTKVEFTAPLGSRLDQIEHCLVLAETVANVLQSDSHLDDDSIIRLLEAEGSLCPGRRDGAVAALESSRMPPSRQLRVSRPRYRRR